MNSRVAETFRLLADPTRLRLMAVLSQEELSVVELQEILDLGQSRISSHLALLRQKELVQDRRDGKRAYYSLHTGLTTEIEKLVRTSLEAVTAESWYANDRLNLERTLQKRQQVAEAYFNTIAGRLGKNYCPGRSWESIGHLLLLLTPKLTIADLGAGEGLISQLLARRAEHVYCVDNSKRMVEVGRDLAERNQLSNLTYVLGDIEAVPLEDGSVDLAILSQALHHANHPAKALAEAFRILKKGGQLAILDLRQHAFEKARELYADRWLGFSENQLHQLCQEAGFRQLEVKTVSEEREAPHFATLLASGLKP